MARRRSFSVRARSPPASSVVAPPAASVASTSTGVSCAIAYIRTLYNSADGHRSISTMRKWVVATREIARLRSLLIGYASSLRAACITSSESRISPSLTHAPNFSTRRCVAMTLCGSPRTCTPMASAPGQRSHMCSIIQIRSSLVCDTSVIETPPSSSAPLFFLASSSSSSNAAPAPVAAPSMLRTSESMLASSSASASASASVAAPSSASPSAPTLPSPSACPSRPPAPPPSSSWPSRVDTSATSARSLGSSADFAPPPPRRRVAN
mmetsp:Transcript_23111/g.59386  ORF Transcript_23111/g.59386 Transcript_23111/m.59386 type:complete len:267 (-) Transcript_23111:338-1138(-)